MRAVWLAVALAGCFRPTPPEGFACGPDSWCPEPLRCASDGTCRSTDSTTDADPPDVDADPTRVNLAFVSSTLRRPMELGGPAAADTACNDLAHAAGHQGTFVAWVSTDTMAVKDRLGNARGWVRFDGRPFADTQADLFAGKLYYPLRRDERGLDRTVEVMTGSTNNGDGVDPTIDCQRYTVADPSANMLVGQSDGGVQRWTEDGEQPCDRAYGFYCLQVDRAFPPPLPNASGPIAFVSRQMFNPITGVVGADAVCAADALDAGLAGTFQALLATTNQSALARFMPLPAQPWVRVDRVATTRDFTTWDAPIDVTAAGVYLTAEVLTGSTAADLPAPNVMQNCNNWASTINATSWVGSAARAGPAAFGRALIGLCGSAGRVYCLQRL